MDRLLILGLDGFDKRFVEQNLEDLDNLRSMSSEEEFCDLESTLPPITIPAWPCSYTGRRPEKLDRFDFQAINFEDYSFSPVDETWSEKEFWSFIDGEVALADVSGAPVREINGSIVSGLFDVGEDSTYPSDLHEEISSDIGNFEIEGLENYDSEKKRREKAFEFFGKRKKLLYWFLDNRDADIYFTVFRLPDTMMHHCSTDKQMLEAYRKCDKMLGELMGREDLNIVIVSDHGAVKATRRFSINTWLKKNGYLETKSAAGDESARGSLRSGIGDRFRSLALEIAEMGERFGFRDYLVRANELYKEYADEAFVDTNLDLDSVKWGNTEAFSYMTGVCAYAGIWINDNRFPIPAVEDRQEKKEELKKHLEQHSLVDEVLLKEKAFVEDTETFPDLVAVLGENVKNDSDIKPSVTGKISSYMHRKKGVIGVYGDSFAMSEDNAELIDLAPTVLHYLGEDIPAEMDGKVMDIFSRDSEPDRRDLNYTSEEVADLDF